MQDLNSGFYKFELEDISAFRARRVFGIATALTKYIGILFIVLGCCLFMYLNLIIAFVVTGVVMIAVAILLDYLGGRKVFNYVYSYSVENFQIVKKFRSGKIEVLLDTGDKKYSVEPFDTEVGVYQGAVMCVPRDLGGDALNKYYIRSESGERYLVATDDFMMAVLRGRHK